MIPVGAPEAGFDGTREVRVTVSPYQRTHVDDFALRFVTQKPNGVLFSTVDSRSNKYFKVELENGRAKLSTNLNGRDKVCANFHWKRNNFEGK